MVSYKFILALSFFIAATQAFPQAKFPTRQYFNQSRYLNQTGRFLNQTGHFLNQTNPSGSGTINIQTFTGSLGCGATPVYYDTSLGVGGSNRPFKVGDNTFDQAASALERSCSIQKNCCADDVNDGAFEGAVSDCDNQQAKCMDAANIIASKYSNSQRRGVTPLKIRYSDLRRRQRADGLRR